MKLEEKKTTFIFKQRLCSLNIYSDIPTAKYSEGHKFCENYSNNILNVFLKDNKYVF